jgi:DNA-binding CsgD family transcriptional regulator
MNGDAKRTLALTRPVSQLTSDSPSISPAHPVSQGKSADFRGSLGDVAGNGGVPGPHAPEAGDELGLDTLRLLIGLIHCGTIVVSHQLQVVFANRLAMEIAGRPEAGIKLHDGRLRLVRSCTARALNELVSEAIEKACTDRGGRALGAVCVPDAQGRPYYALQVFSGTRSSHAPLAFIMIIDLRAAEMPQRAIFAKLFSLTDKEAELTELFAQSKDLETIAAAMAISENTARVHLRNVFLKTGVAGQVALARLLARLSEGRGGPLLESVPQTPCHMPSVSSEQKSQL